MKLSNSLFQICLFFVFIVLLSSSCKKDDEPNVDLNFDLIGKWNLQTVEGNNLLETCVDTMPMGFIEFNSDGTGDASFYFQLCSYPAADFQETTIDFVLDTLNPPTFVDVTFADGQEFEWNLSEGTDTSVIASFNYLTVETKIFMTR